MWGVCRDTADAEVKALQQRLSDVEASNRSNASQQAGYDALQKELGMKQKELAELEAAMARKKEAWERRTEELETSLLETRKKLLTAEEKWDAEKRRVQSELNSVREVGPTPLCMWALTPPEDNALCGPAAVVMVSGVCQFTAPL